MPPFWYVTPFMPGGRVRERDAVAGMAAAAGDAGGSGSLETEMELQARLSSNRWFVPSQLTVRTTAAGELDSGVVSQSRSVYSSLSRSSPVAQSERGTGSMAVSAGATFTRDFLLDTEVLNGNLTVYFAYASISGRSWQVNQTTSWNRLRQHAGAPRLAIYPDAPSSEPPPAFRADSDRLTTTSAFQFSWRADRVPRATPLTLLRRLGVEPGPQRVTNTEGVTVESAYTFADPATLGTTSLLPVRVTLEHDSDVEHGDHLVFHLGIRFQGGAEERITSGIPELVPGFGLEGELGVRIRY
jgi:hypothetical protein